MTWFNDLISGTSQVSQIIISIALMLLFGFLFTRITKKLKLPNVTAYILAGIVIGPYCLNLIPASIIDGTEFISDIALAFIAFSVGEFFKLDTLKKNGLKIVVLTLFESLMASVVVFIVSYFILRLGMAFSIVLAALASATAPASTIMTIRQTKAKGEFVDTLLQVVALDDVVSLVAYSVAISIAIVSLGNGNGFSASVIYLPILKNLAVIVIGIIFGLLMKVFIANRKSSDNRLIIVICGLFLFCGICSLLDVSPLLGCMIIGTTYINVAKDEKLFLQVNYFSPPILLLFFVRSGLSFNLDSLFSNSSLVGTVPLWVIGLTYFFVRIVGKCLGSYLGCLVIKKPKEVRNYLGLALIPQAGVAIGLASLGARTLGGDTGNALHTVILASCVLYELVGPGCAKLALYLSKSYSNKIEDKVEVDIINEKGNVKSEVEILIERIQKIQKEVEETNIYKNEEDAFTEGAMDLIESQYVPPRQGIFNRRKF
jgi:Kef-type K+ transport system membrane component KefB